MIFFSQKLVSFEVQLFSPIICNGHFFSFSDNIFVDIPKMFIKSQLTIELCVLKVVKCELSQREFRIQDVLMLIKAGINLFLNEDQTCFRVINPSLISKKVDILTSPVFWQVITSAIGQETSFSFLEYSEHRRIESLRWIYLNKD